MGSTTVSPVRVEPGVSDDQHGNLITGETLQKMFVAGWVILPTSCGCGGSYAWLKPRPSGAKEMFGCVCHKTGQASADFFLSR